MKNKNKYKKISLIFTNLFSSIWICLLILLIVLILSLMREMTDEINISFVLLLNFGFKSSYTYIDKYIVQKVYNLNQFIHYQK